MRKGVTIFLGLMVAALMLTSFLSAVNSEILIAKNTALVVQSHPVIASDATLSALEPEKYDAMIDSFQAENNDALPESDQSGALTGISEKEQDPAMPAAPDTLEHESSTAAALVNEPDAGNSNDTPAPDQAPNVDAPVEQHRPAPMHAAAEINNDSVVKVPSPGMNGNNTVFTVQAGSYTNKVNAESKYTSLIHDMSAADLDNLRIEKIGNYYTVRIGRFDHYVTAMKFLNAMDSKLSSAIVIKAYILNERLVALHNNALLAGK